MSCGVVANQRGQKFWATENILVEAEDMVQVNADQQKEASGGDV